MLVLHTATDWEVVSAAEDGLSALVPLLMLDMGYNPEQPERAFDAEEYFALLIGMMFQFYAILGAHFLRSAPLVRETPKIGRNDPCVCGSGKKYKKCCGARDVVH
jgi:uncharacterized protein